MVVNFHILVSAVLLCGMLALSAPNRVGAEKGPLGTSTEKQKMPMG